MNVTRENLNDLELCIKVEVAAADYADGVTKQLKQYRQKAVIPGFRKGMAPMGMIERIYKPTLVADEVNRLIFENLYKYIDDEKLDLIGSPLSNDEKTGKPDFDHPADFTFYFDAALMPKVDVDWSKIDAKLLQIKVPAKEIDTQVENIAKRYGKFETPETIGENDHVYGKAVELGKDGSPKDGGVSVFISFEMSEVKDADIKQSIIGKKNDEKVTFNAFKAFGAAFIEKNFRMESTAAKKFKSDVEFTVSGCSRITPHEINEDLFAQVYPGEEIKDEAKFRKVVGKEIDKANDEQCRILFVNQVRRSLLDNFNATLPEAFLKRWILARDSKELTPEKLDSEWSDKYLPSLKWEILDAALNKIKPIEPNHNDIVDYVKDILKRNDRGEAGETAEAKEDRIEKAAQSIASDRDNVRQIVDRIYVDKTFELFKEQLNPEVEKVTAKEFGERVKADNAANDKKNIDTPTEDAQQILEL